MTKQYILISGYTESGKTTAINFLKENTDGFVASTSAMLHNTVERVIDRLFDINYNSYNKHNHLSYVISDNEGASSIGKINNRTIHIELAEAFIDLMFGREALGRAAFETTLHSDADVVIYECFKPEELEGFIETMYEYEHDTPEIHVLVLDSAYALPDADGRELLTKKDLPQAEFHDIINDRTSLFQEQLLTFITTNIK